MIVEQVKAFYEGKKDTPCDLTKELIKSGYQQRRGGYIKFAHDNGKTVDYTKAEPDQWWHLIESWCNRSNSNHTFRRSIRCGELYFWMAEVSGAFTRDELITIKEEALSIANANTYNNKKPLRTVESNTYIREKCFSRIVETVEDYCKRMDNVKLI